MYRFIKIGMTRFIDSESGKMIPCTLLQCEDIESLNSYSENQYVDAQGFSIGKGFSGVMKRHNFSGGNASHGASKSHRSAGSTGGCQDPGKVFKGKKMAGHQGCAKVTQQNLKVLKKGDNFIVIKGCVPGKRGTVLILKQAVKKLITK